MITRKDDLKINDEVTITDEGNEVYRIGGYYYVGELKGFSLIRGDGSYKNVEEIYFPHNLKKVKG